MYRKITAILLSALFIFCLTAAAPASTKAETFKDKVNALNLEPLKPSYWSSAFIKRVEASVKGKKTNYDKLVAVYDYIRTNETDKKMMADNSSGYALQLQCALEIIGFRTYYVAGNPTLKGKEDWEHRWVGIDIGNGMYYFDAYSPTAYGIEVSKCFAIPYQKAPLYKNAKLVTMEIEPIVTKDGYMKMSLGTSKGIPNSVSKRKPYRSVLDAVYSNYYDADGDYWKLEWIKPDGTIGRDKNPILLTDKNGKKIVCHPDGTRQTYEEWLGNGRIVS